MVIAIIIIMIIIIVMWYCSYNVFSTMLFRVTIFSYTFPGMVQSPVIPFPVKIKPEQNPTGYTMMDQQSNVCCGMNEPQSPSINTYNTQQQHVQPRPVMSPDYNNNMNDAYLQALAGQKSLSMNGGIGSMHTQQQGFQFRIPTGPVPTIGMSCWFFNFYSLHFPVSLL